VENKSQFVNTFVDRKGMMKKKLENDLDIV